MNRGQALVSGISIGALLMYVLDPARGRRRRARGRDKLVHVGHRASDAVGAAARDVRNRLLGLVAELRAAVTEEEVPDEVLAERVRSRLGRVVAHPKSVEVSACQGLVTLRGTVYEHETGDLLHAVGEVRGVRQVRDRLVVRRRRGEPEAAQARRVPAGAATAAAAALLLAYGMRRRGVPGGGLVLLGLGLAWRSPLRGNPGRLVRGVDAGANATPAVREQPARDGAGDRLPREMAGRPSA